MNALSTTTLEDRIAAKIDSGITGSLAVSDQAGGAQFVNIGQVMEFSKMMAVSQIGVRKHLRNNPGACLAVCMQAIEWRLSPFAVANKSYLVNDQIAYEAQLLHAVVLLRAPIIGRPKHEYSGVGPTRALRVWGTLSDGSGEVVDYESQLIRDIKPQNSPLWKAEPDQQLHYYSIRAWARRHFPDVLLGVYARDEMEGAEPIETPKQPRQSLAQRLQPAAPTSTGFDREHIDAETGEVIDGEVVDAEPETAAVSEEAPTDGEPSEDDTASDEGEAESLIDVARSVSLGGTREFLRWHGGLTEAEAKEIAPEFKKLKAAACAADGEAQ